MTSATAPIRRTLRALVLGSTVAFGAACYHAPRMGAVEPATVTVDNQSFYDFNLYVIPEGGAERRLGFVRSKSRKSFTIPADILPGTRSLRFEARPIATQTGPVSESVVMSPGDEVGLAIPPS